MDLKPLQIGENSYFTLKAILLTQSGPIFPPSPSRPSQALSHAISSLSLHPSLEAALHILNHDLQSSHFLVRHMQAAPQYESMFLHGILHRIEGDFDNARAWYNDVSKSEVFMFSWGTTSEKNGKDGAMEFLDRIETLRKKMKVRERENGVVEGLERESMREIKAVLEFCEKKFGTEKLADASGVWVQNEKSSGQGNDMVTGGEGWRQF
jgi:hypothetical protein